MNITPSAIAKINQTLTDSEYLRVEVNGGGCSGFTVGLTRTDVASESDTWRSEKVIIDPTSEEYLSGATLEWIDDPFNSTFNFKVPNTKSCGCGNSFQFEDT